MIHLTLEELLHVAERAIGAPPELRDAGLLESAAARPAATAFGEDAYEDLAAKAAALLHSIVRNHPLVDGNKRLGLASALVFLGANGRRLTLTEDEAYLLVMAVADGTLDDVPAIAGRLRAGSAPR